MSIKISVKPFTPVKKKGIKPTIATNKEEKLEAKPLPSMAAMVNKTKKEIATPSLQSESLEELSQSGPYNLEQKLEEIERLMEAQNIPVQTLKHNCDEIMKDLKRTPEIVLDLEPEQISTIVQGYIKAADEEIKKVLTPKTKVKKKKKAKLSSKAQSALDMAKEMELGEEIDF